jgi:hypothetical protein
MVNMCIASIALFSIELYQGSRQQLNIIMLRADRFNRKRSKIFHYIESTCSKIFDDYPEFDRFLQFKLRENYHISFTLGKIAGILSALYDTYLPYGLYGPPSVTSD